MFDLPRGRTGLVAVCGISVGLIYLDARGIMRRMLIPKREWIRYLASSGELVNDRGWPLHSELDEKLRSAGFDRDQPVECDLVPGTTTLRSRQLTDA